MYPWAGQTELLERSWSQRRERCPPLHCPHGHCHVAGRQPGSGRRRSDVFVSRPGLIGNTCTGSLLSSQPGCEAAASPCLCLLIWGTWEEQPRLRGRILTPLPHALLPLQPRNLVWTLPFGRDGIIGLMPLASQWLPTQGSHCSQGLACVLCGSCCRPSLSAL